MIGELITAGSRLLGGVLTDKGTAKANAQNIQLAREQMRFQERMSSTAYQRATEDLAKAGLNRILALGSPASSPAGARATVENENAGIGSGVGESVSSAMQTAVQRATMKNLSAVTERELSTAGLNRKLVDKADAEIKLANSNSALQDERSRTAKVEADFYTQVGEWIYGALKHFGISGIVGAGIGKGFGRKPPKNDPTLTVVPKRTARERAAAREVKKMTSPKSKGKAKEAQKAIREAREIRKKMERR